MSFFSFNFLFYIGVQLIDHVVLVLKEKMEIFFLRVRKSKINSSFLPSHLQDDRCDSFPLRRS